MTCVNGSVISWIVFSVKMPSHFMLGIMASHMILIYHTLIECILFLAHRHAVFLPSVVFASLRFFRRPSQCAGHPNPARFSGRRLGLFASRASNFRSEKEGQNGCSWPV